MTTADIAPDTISPAHQVTMTDAASNKARVLIDRDASSEMMLRLAVQPGGCSGMRYELFFDDRTLDGDAIVNFEGVRLVVDKLSQPHVEGAVIDFADTIEKQGFSIDNPNAGNSCACGDSFQ